MPTNQHLLESTGYLYIQWLGTVAKHLSCLVNRLSIMRFLQVEQEGFNRFLGDEHHAVDDSSETILCSCRTIIVNGSQKAL
jgi:hypothetical protein